jgi:hypothetical protein
MRSKIIEAFRKFGQYYFYRFNNDQCTDLVAKIIRRYSLNVGNTDHGKLYIVDDNYLADKLKVLLEMQGEIGLIIKLDSFQDSERRSSFMYTISQYVQTLRVAAATNST